jgi:hypothetical protein
VQVSLQLCLHGGLVVPVRVIAESSWAMFRPLRFIVYSLQPVGYSLHLSVSFCFVLWSTHFEHTGFF